MFAYLTVSTGAPDTFGFRTTQQHKVEAKRVPVSPNYRLPASGYGSRIPVAYMVKWNNRWRRVYCMIYSNSGTLYIRSPKNVDIFVNDIWQESESINYCEV